MDEYFYRTEDIRPEEVKKFFVESAIDREIVNKIKSRHPVVLVGSRGVGKSFLMRVAEQELLADIEDGREFPVYVSFIKSSLLTGADEPRVRAWMMSRICAALIRRLRKTGRLVGSPQVASLLAGGGQANDAPSAIELIADKLESAWKGGSAEIDVSIVPEVDEFRDAIEDVLEELNLKRVVFLFDEAAHIFLPEQQRIFFTLFRDLRCPAIVCNAAVYPGVTSFGDTFQPSHDATMVPVDRDVSDSDYLKNMKEIVALQSGAAAMKRIDKNGQNFSALAYAASGNPRLLLKTVGQSPKMTSTEVSEVIRTFYRVDIWSDHSNLAEKYQGHRPLIDWGRRFIEEEVLPEIQRKNIDYIEGDKSTSAYFWMHRDTPEVVKQAIRVLCYTGIVKENDSGIRATRSEVGTRFIVNLGALVALDSAPLSSIIDVAKRLTPKRMTEYGANYPSYAPLVSDMAGVSGETASFSLMEQMAKGVDFLDLTDWQIEKLKELNLNTVGEVFETNEDTFKKAHYVGQVRARQMRNAAQSAVLEYLSG